MAIYDYSYTSIEGKTVSLSEYKGKVLLIVNTASECGFTPQYEGLEKLYETYRDKGLVIVGFPCNQFGGQEPGSNEEVKEFCKLRFGVSFPLSQKIDVRGEKIDPIFAFLTSEAKFEGFGAGQQGLVDLLKEKFGIAFEDDSIKWNFTKFLISKDGQNIRRFEPPVTPEELEGDIKAALGL